MINEDYISKIAFKALISEVTATPKPGLVDLRNQGSHNDMDYYTFIDSSVALNDYFKTAFYLGTKNYNLDDFLDLREEGKIAELKMLEVTGGVNTHKGIIFSLGLLVYATAIQYRLNDLDNLSIVNRVKKLCLNVTHELNYDIKTAGGYQYRKYGLKGIRKEAEDGFIKAITIGLPNFKKYLLNNSFNDAIVNTLIHFMKDLDDSNIIKRGGIEGLLFTKKSAQHAIDLGLMETPEGRDYIYYLDDEFIKRNLSPGGAADYIILTLYFYFLEQL